MSGRHSFRRHPPRYRKRTASQRTWIFIQLEGVFSVLKQDYAFRRFLLGGKKKVLVEFTLLAFAYNIQKLFNKTIKVINI